MPAPSLPLRRKLVFAAILAVVATAFLLVATELLLRAAGFGYSTRFVRKAVAADGSAIWRENRWCTAPYFSPALVRRPVPFRLPLTKSPRAYRIVVLGSSAAMGDPEASFSMARMLETMLRVAYPEIEFEVVNAGITAINSHVLRGIAADCTALEPDLFIVYEGHNEVIGPFGPAGVFSPSFRSPLLLRAAAALKVTRTGQAVSALTRTLRGDSEAPAEWRGMQMFLGQRIPADDPRLDAVRDHFARNLSAIVRSAQAAHARTLLCTVLTNQRDFPPFLSLHAPGLGESELKTWEEKFAAANRAVAAGDIAAARTAFAAAAAIDDRHAELAFRRGRFELEHGDPAVGRALLQAAVDLDALRFRAGSQLNQAVRDVAAGNGSQAELVDLVASVGARSRGGVAGDDLVYEHVHLTLRGTYEVARELFPRVSADLVRRGRTTSAQETRLSYDEARIRLGFSAYEQAMIAMELLHRFQSAPFTAQTGGAQRIQNWSTRVDAALQLLARPEAADALEAASRQALQWSPHDWVLARNAGSMLVAQNRPAEALPLLQQAAAWIDDDVDTLVALGRCYDALDRAAESAEAFARARRLDPRYPGLPAETSPARRP